MQDICFFHGEPFAVIQISARQTLSQTVPYICGLIDTVLSTTHLTNFLLAHPPASEESDNQALKFAILRELRGRKVQCPQIRVAGATFLRLDWLDGAPEARGLYDEIYPVDVGNSDRMRRFYQKLMELASALICSETVKNFYNSSIVRQALARGIPVFNLRRGAYADDPSAGPDLRKDAGYQHLLAELEQSLTPGQREALEPCLRRMANYMQDFYEDFYLRREVSGEQREP